MIDFMVIAAPRSGTAWSANWLSTDTSICFHELSSRMHYTEWDSIESNKMIGCADTNISYFSPDWLNKHPARKVILHRSDEERVASSGIIEDLQVNYKLDQIEGMHVYWDAVFLNPKPIYEHLLQKEFDEERHNTLKLLQINSIAEKVKRDPQVLYRLMSEMREKLKELSNVKA